MEVLIEKIKEYKIIVVCVGLGLAVGAFFLLKPGPEIPVKDTSPQTELESSVKVKSKEEIPKDIEETTEVVERDLITVDVKGAVKSPGIYNLPLGSRVHDAVQKAGGMTENADGKTLNLAQKVSDESLVYVPSKEETDIQETSPNTTSSKESKKVNINKASLEELKQVKGLGGKRAQDIIDYRESKGTFKSVDDLKKVSGIGAKTIEKLKDYVTVD